MPPRTAARLREKPRLTVVGDARSGGHLPLAERAYAAIKDKLLRLELQPGQFLNEQALCAMLELGRTPVHQAVHRLMLEGLIDIIPRKGLIVRPDSLNELLNLLEARWAMEGNIAALAAERATPPQIEEMQKLLNEGSRLTDQRHRQRFMEIDRAFHALVARAAGNQILADVMRPIHERSARIWRLPVRNPSDLKITQVEHEAILQGIVKGDRATATKAMQQHIGSLRARMLRNHGL